MSDIDFDELDKAVSSLVDDKGDKKDEKVENASEQKPSVENDTNESPKTTDESPSKHSGRFMDLVHSSSDMRKEGSGMMNTSTTNITPIDDNVKAEPINPESSESDENPDGDNSSSSDTDKDKEDDSNNDKDTAKDESKKTDEKDDDKKTTPFIDSAKVKKRPLGGANSDLSISSDAKKMESSESSIETSTEPVILPPELDKDLVAIESGEAPETSQETVELPRTTEETAALQEATDVEKDKKPPVKDQKEEVAQLLASANSGSIPDQYKRENRSHELHTPHPLFNFEHYGSSSAKTAKGPKSKASSIFQWIFIIIGLLLLGGSIGAAIFVFVSKL